MKTDLTLLYFASLGENLGVDKESITLENDTPTIATLKTQLAVRGDTWAKLLRDKSTRCAVNPAIANDNTALNNGDDVAFFPPVTGG